jgi:protein SCO1
MAVSSPTRSRVRASGLLLALAALVALVATACGGGAKSSSSSSMRGDVLNPPVALPASAGPFTSTAGGATTLGDLQTGKLMLVFFGYTHCPDVCPLTMADVGQALRESDPDVRDATRVVFVTSDPERDTPSVLHEWLSHFDTGLPNKFVGLTASTTLIDSTAKKIGVPLEPPVKQKDGTITVDHGAQLLAFQNGAAHVLWLSGTTVADYKHDLTQLVKQQPAKRAEAGA